MARQRSLWGFRGSLRNSPFPFRVSLRTAVGTDECCWASQLFEADNWLLSDPVEIALGLDGVFIIGTSDSGPGSRRRGCTSRSSTGYRRQCPSFAVFAASLDGPQDVLRGPPPGYGRLGQCGLSRGCSHRIACAALNEVAESSFGFSLDGRRRCIRSSLALAAALGSRAEIDSFVPVGSGIEGKLEVRALGCG